MKISTEELKQFDVETMIFYLCGKMLSYSKGETTYKETQELRRAITKELKSRIHE